MIIYSTSGKILFKSIDKTAKSTLEHAIDQGIDLSYADLRGGNFKGASLDGLRGHGACFWGADLTGADMGGADLGNCDLRGAEMVDTCLAGSNLAGADLRGAYFEGTIFEGVILDDVQISCPSFWNCELQPIKSFKNMVYVHKGETEVLIKSIPLVVRGLPLRLLMLGKYVLWGSALYQSGAFPVDVQHALFRTWMMVDRAFQGHISHDAIIPNPKSIPNT